MLIKGGIDIKKYNIIYADPPWSYRSGNVKGAAKNHYPTMTDQAIYDLPVGEIADDNAVLFLWATFPKLIEAFKTMKAWGFSYKTCAFVWVKQNRKSEGLFFGLGYWTRGNAEICLLGVKGKPKRVSARIFQIVLSRIREHSRKPDEVRERIVELMGNLKRVELFAREKIEGWDSWGNEVVSDIALESEEK